MEIVQIQASIFLNLAEFMRGIRKQNIKIALFFDVYVKKVVFEHLGRIKIHFRLHMDSSVVIYSY